MMYFILAGRGFANVKGKVSQKSKQTVVRKLTPAHHTSVLSAYVDPDDVVLSISEDVDNKQLSLDAPPTAPLSSQGTPTHKNIGITSTAEGSICATTESNINVTPANGVNSNAASRGSIKNRIQALSQNVSDTSSYNRRRDIDNHASNNNDVLDKNISRSISYDPTRVAQIDASARSSSKRVGSSSSIHALQNQIFGDSPLQRSGGQVVIQKKGAGGNTKTLGRLKSPVHGARVEEKDSAALSRSLDELDQIPSKSPARNSSVSRSVHGYVTSESTPTHKLSVGTSSPAHSNEDVSESSHF